MIKSYLFRISAQIIHKQYRFYVRSIQRRQIRDETSNEWSKQIEQDWLDAEDDDPEPDLSSFEGDFNQLSKSHRQYERDTARHTQFLRHSIVRDKYFKEKTPINFLTWAEKEKIRFLYNEDPVEWNAERLANSFPANVETICKIIKSKWLPKNPKRIEMHDANVNKNWKNFRENRLIADDMDPALKKHLKQFSTRIITKHISSVDLQIKHSLPMPKTTEFLEIIQKKEAQNNTAFTGRLEHFSGTKIKKSQQQIKKNIAMPPDDSTYLIDKIKSKEPITYKQLESKLLLTSQTDNANKQPDNQVDKNVEISKSNQQIDHSSNDDHVALDTIEKFNFQKIWTDDEYMKHLSMPPIRETIKIPKRFYRPGATYRLDDCFYDDDGEFLYRVPGMKKS